MDSISQIKSKLDIVDVVSQYISLKKSGKNYTANCPFHGEKTPSFMVSQDLQIYKCFGCGISGDMFSFIQQIEGIDFVQALDILAEKSGVTLQKNDYDKTSFKKKTLYQINQVASIFYNHLLYHPVGKQALQYLQQKRGLKDSTIKLFNLGFSTNNYSNLNNFLIKKGFKQQDILESGLVLKSHKSNNYIDKFRNRIMFPFVDTAGKTIAFTARSIDGTEPKYLNSPETLIFHKHNYVYGLDKSKVAIKSKGAIFVEGQMDLISSYQAGFDNVVASSGTAITNEQLQLIKRYTNDLTFCLDTDNAGVNAVYKAVDLAEKQNFNIKVAVIPKDYKDIDELIKNNFNQAEQILNNSSSAYDFFIANKLSKYDKNQSYGKKRIIEELKPLLEKISNKVLFESYLKELQKELDIDYETLKQIIVNNVSTKIIKEPTNYVFLNQKNVDLETYYFSLLLKAEIDFIKSNMYNFDPEDWINLDVKYFLQKLHQLIASNSTFDINKYINSLDQDYKAKVKDLYMQDINFDKKEFEEILNRIRKIGGKNKIKRLTSNIKFAEKQGDYNKVSVLLKEIEKIKQVLLN